MRILTASTSPQLDRSFQIGLAAVVLFAAAELSSVAYYYLRRFRAPVTQSASMSAPAPAQLSPSKLASPPQAIAPAPALSGVDQLLQQAKEFRVRGDMTNALSRLHQAADAEPNNVAVLQEMATTYDQLQFVDRANETWRRIQELGPSAGPAYEMAVARLTHGLPAVSPSVAAASPAPAARIEDVPPQTVETAAAATPLFAISDAKVTEEPDPDADTNLTLHIAVKKLTNAAVDHAKVKIQVFFYDLVDDKDAKLTDADVTYDWETRNHDWAGPDPEVLRVNYLRPRSKSASSDSALAAAAASINPGRKGKPAMPSAATDGGKREYLGYIVRVFYHDHLQAEKAEPKRLLQLFPVSPGASQ
jgi:hypothetical protein